MTNPLSSPRSQWLQAGLATLTLMIAIVGATIRIQASINNRFEELQTEFRTEMSALNDSVSSLDARIAKIEGKLEGPYPSFQDSTDQ